MSKLTENTPDRKEIKWYAATIDNLLKFNRLFQIGTLCAALWFSAISKKQSREIEALTVTNAYLLAESISDSKAINDSPFPWWKKEYNPADLKITMREYNDIFYYYFLKDLGFSRFHYTRRTDFEVFAFSEATKFYTEDLALVKRFLKQEPLANGKRPLLIEEYDTEFINLNGELNSSGYWRYVKEENGHIYIYGRMKEPVLKKEL